jgi:hypothetical protein
VEHLREAHSTLAIALNRLGGFSNTGEGGEDPARYGPGFRRVRSRSFQDVPIVMNISYMVILYKLYMITNILILYDIYMII